MKKLSKTAKFIIKANEKHNNKYDYSKSVYTGSCDPIIITCPKHGDFSSQPYRHLRGNGCKSCAIEIKGSSQLLTTGEFIKRATFVHGNGRYDYCNAVYKNAKTKLEVKCTECNTKFFTNPANHIQGNGCPTCAVSNQGYNRSAYIERAKRYDNKSKLYILKCFNDEEEFYKIGINMTSIKKRYPTKKSMPYQYEIVLILEDDAGQIWDLEKNLHSELRPLFYTPKISFAGQHECYTELSVEIKNKINSSINKANNLKI